MKFDINMNLNITIQDGTREAIRERKLDRILAHQRHMEQSLMETRDELNAKLDAGLAAEAAEQALLVTLNDGIDRLQAQIEDLKNHPGLDPELAAKVAQLSATSIANKDTLVAIAAKGAPVVVEPPVEQPAPVEPAPEAVAS